VRKRVSIGLLLAAVGALALVAAGCGGGGNKSSSTAAQQGPARKLHEYGSQVVAPTHEFRSIMADFRAVNSAPS